MVHFIYALIDVFHSLIFNKIIMLDEIHCFNIFCEYSVLFHNLTSGLEAGINDRGMGCV